GQKMELLSREPTKGGKSKWVESEIIAYGEAPVRTITLSRRGVEKTIRATDNHRWFTYSSPNQAVKFQRVKEKTTSQLKIDDVVLGCLPPAVAYRTRL